MQEAALSSAQCLHSGISTQQTLVKDLHQLIGGVVLYWPEAHHQRRGPSSQECASQAQLLVTSAAECQSGFRIAADPG